MNRKKDTTRGEAIAYFKRHLDLYCVEGISREAEEMAIKALEQEDKIKAEIDQKQYDFMADKDYDEGVRFGLMLAYQIIDKYKAESEG